MDGQQKRQQKVDKRNILDKFSAVFRQNGADVFILDKRSVNNRSVKK